MCCTKPYSCRRSQPFVCSLTVSAHRKPPPTPPSPLTDMNGKLTYSTSDWLPSTGMRNYNIWQMSTKHSRVVGCPSRLKLGNLGSEIAHKMPSPAWRNSNRWIPSTKTRELKRKISGPYVLDRPDLLTCVYTYMELESGCFLCKCLASLVPLS